MYLNRLIMARKLTCLLLLVVNWLQVEFACDNALFVAMAYSPTVSVRRMKNLLQK